MDQQEESGILKGGIYGVLGIISRIVFLFVINLFLARLLGAHLYGVWSLNYIIITFFNLIVLFGLERGVIKFISSFRGGEKTSGIAKVIITALYLVILSSLFFSLLLFVSSDSIAQFFKMYDLGWILKIMAFGLLPASLIEIIASIYQGFENIKMSRIINSIIPNFLWLALVLFLFFFKDINLLNVSVVYLIFNWLSALISIIFLIYLIKKIRIEGFWKKTLNPFKNIEKGLLSFSSPLLLFNFLSLIGLYTDSLIIGYFRGPYEVGIYSIAFRIARLSPFLLLGVTDIFLPAASKSLAKNNNNSEINSLYFRVAKWSFVPTLLIVMTIIGFSGFFLNFFGKDFTDGSLALKLLLFGYLIFAFIGPIEATNIALGRTKFVAIYTFCSLVFSVVLNIILVPKFGIEGAAVVSIFSIILSKAIAMIGINILDKVKVFNMQYFKFFILSFTTGLIIIFLTNKFVGSSIYGVIVFVLAMGLSELFFLLKTKIMDEKDKLLLIKMLNILHLPKI